MHVLQRKIERLDKPYGDCETKQDLIDDNQAFYYNGDYSLEVQLGSDGVEPKNDMHFQGCLRSCFQSQMVDKCKCYDPRFPYSDDGNTPVCSITNQVQSKHVDSTRS